MGWNIFASLDSGLPTLKIVDPSSQDVVLHWQYKSQANDTTFDSLEIKKLFQQLILLTCQQQAKNNRLFSLGQLENIAKLSQ